MAKTKFLGARVEEDVYTVVEKVAKEERIDKTSAVKLLVLNGWKAICLKKALEEYGHGRASIDKAARIAGITVSEMMDEAAIRGIGSQETIEEYKQGLKLLMK